MNEMEYSNYHEVIAYELRDAVERYFKVWELALEKKPEERESLGVVVEQPRLSVVILSTVLLECSINFYLSVKCNADEFQALGKMSLQDKWQLAPAWFAKGYRFPGGAALAEDLKRLVQRRNRIIHTKPYIAIDGETRHKGNEPEISFDEHDFICRSATLAWRLIDNLLQHDEEARMPLWSLRTYVGVAAGAVSAGEQKMAVHATISKDLLREIMSRGYDRETAIRCALLLGPNPKLGADGKLTVWLNPNKSIKLEPLKFFGSAVPPSGS
jgi:hypothetical protein